MYEDEQGAEELNFLKIDGSALAFKLAQRNIGLAIHYNACARLLKCHCIEIKTILCPPLRSGDRIHSFESKYKLTNCLTRRQVPRIVKASSKGTENTQFKISLYTLFLIIWCPTICLNVGWSVLGRPSQFWSRGHSSLIQWRTCCMIFIHTILYNVGLLFLCIVEMVDHPWRWPMPWTITPCWLVD